MEIGSSTPAGSHREQQEFGWNSASMKSPDFLAVLPDRGILKLLSNPAIECLKSKVFQTPFFILKILFAHRYNMDFKGYYQR